MLLSKPDYIQLGAFQVRRKLPAVPAKKGFRAVPAMVAQALILKGGKPFVRYKHPTKKQHLGRQLDVPVEIVMKHEKAPDLNVLA